MNLKELFNDALPIIRKFAPTVGTIIGGPFGVATGYIIPILASAFDSRPSDIKGLVAKILSDPDAQTKLQEVEEEHRDWLDSILESVNHLVKAEINVKLEWQNAQK